MKLVQALLEDDKVRRASWPEGLYVSSGSGHSIGATPIVLNDVEAEEDPEKVPGLRRHLFLKKMDPKGRSVPEKSLGHGMVRPAQDVVEISIPYWQPSVDDLFADNWAVL